MRVDVHVGVSLDCRFILQFIHTDITNLLTFISQMNTLCKLDMATDVTGKRYMQFGIHEQYILLLSVVVYITYAFLIVINLNLYDDLQTVLDSKLFVNYIYFTKLTHYATHFILCTDVTVTLISRIYCIMSIHSC